MSLSPFPVIDLGPEVELCKGRHCHALDILRVRLNVGQLMVTDSTRGASSVL